MTTAGLANDSLIIPARDFAFPVAFRTYLPCFRVEGRSSMGTLVLHFIFDVRFTFLSIAGVTHGSGNLLCFIVFKINDESPLRSDGVLCHV